MTNKERDNQTKIQLDEHMYKQKDGQAGKRKQSVQYDEIRFYIIQDVV